MLKTMIQYWPADTAAEPYFWRLEGVLDFWVKTVNFLNMSLLKWNSNHILFALFNVNSSPSTSKHNFSFENISAAISDLASSLDLMRWSISSKMNVSLSMHKYLVFLQKCCIQYHPHSSSLLEWSTIVQNPWWACKLSSLVQCDGAVTTRMRMCNGMTMHLPDQQFCYTSKPTVIVYCDQWWVSRVIRPI